MTLTPITTDQGDDMMLAAEKALADLYAAAARTKPAGVADEMFALVMTASAYLAGLAIGRYIGADVDALNRTVANHELTAIWAAGAEANRIRLAEQSKAKRKRNKR